MLSKFIENFCHENVKQDVVNKHLKDKFVYETSFDSLGDIDGKYYETMDHINQLTILLRETGLTKMRLKKEKKRKLKDEKRTWEHLFWSAFNKKTKFVKENLSSDTARRTYLKYKVKEVEEEFEDLE